MTVEKLIRELQNYPLNAKIHYLDTRYNDSFRYREAGIVEARDYISTGTSTMDVDLRPTKICIR